MQPFIESFATQQLLPPYQADNVKTHVFLFRLSTAMVQDFCDRFLNLGEPWSRPYHYVALETSPLGILAISEYPSLKTVEPTKRGVGQIHVGWDDVPQKELFAAAPVIRYSVAAGGILVDPVLQWVQPFLVNDNASAAFAGREIIGMETLWGPIQVKTDETGCKTIRTWLPSWRVFGRDSPQELLHFLVADTGPPLTQAEVDQREAEVKNNPSVYADLVALAEEIPNLNAFIQGLMPSVMTMVVLKQFREAGDPCKAVYQALVTADCHFENVRDPLVYAPEACCAQFTTGAMVNEIISTLLGEPVAALNAVQRNAIAGDEKRDLEVRMGCGFTSDIRFDGIRTLHEFPIV